MWYISLCVGDRPVCRSGTQFRNLINRQAKEDKEEWLGQYCEETENQLIRGNAKKSYNLV
jgi:hypothetical protein